MRIAFLADIHGNLPALEAVLADLASQSPDAVYLVGDQVNRCPWSNDVLDLIGERGWQGIRGNHELVLESPRRDRMSPTSSTIVTVFRIYGGRWSISSRTTGQAIAELPDELSLDLGVGEPMRSSTACPEIRFADCSSTPTNEAIEHFRSVKEPIVICGHTHRQLSAPCYPTARPGVC